MGDYLRRPGAVGINNNNNHKILRDVYKMGWKDVDQTHCHHLDREEGMWLGVRLKVYLTVNAL